MISREVWRGYLCSNTDDTYDRGKITDMINETGDRIARKRRDNVIREYEIDSIMIQLPI